MCIFAAYAARSTRGARSVCSRPFAGRGTVCAIPTMNRLLHSVRLRLTLWYAGVLALALALFAVSVYVFVVRSLESSIDQALGSYGQQVNRASGPPKVNSVGDYRLSYPK